MGANYERTRTAFPAVSRTCAKSRRRLRKVPLSERASLWRGRRARSPAPAAHPRSPALPARSPALGAGRPHRLGERSGISRPCAKSRPPCGPLPDAGASMRVRKAPPSKAGLAVQTSRVRLLCARSPALRAIVRKVPPCSSCAKSRPLTAQRAQDPALGAPPSSNPGRKHPDSPLRAQSPALPEPARDARIVSAGLFRAQSPALAAAIPAASCAKSPPTRPAPGPTGSCVCSRLRPHARRFVPPRHQATADERGAASRPCTERPAPAP